MLSHFVITLVALCNILKGMVGEQVNPIFFKISVIINDNNNNNCLLLLLLKMFYDDYYL